MANHKLSHPEAKTLIHSSYCAVPHTSQTLNFSPQHDVKAESKAATDTHTYNAFMLVRNKHYYPSSPELFDNFQKD